MKFKKFATVSALSVLAFSMVACSQGPDSSFKNNLDLGYYKGMHITWVKDDSDTQGTGFYVIDDVHVDKNQPNNTDFDNERLIGHYGDLNIMWVKDRTDANSKGFYLFRNANNQIVSSLSMAEKFSNGKTTTTKNVGSVFVSNINNPQLQITLDDKPYQETVKVSDLSPSQLIQLSQRLLAVAQEKELENKPSVKSKF